MSSYRSIKQQGIGFHKEQLRGYAETQWRKQDKRTSTQGQHPEAMRGRQLHTIEPKRTRKAKSNRYWTASKNHGITTARCLKLLHYRAVRVFLSRPQSLPGQDIREKKNHRALSCGTGGNKRMKERREGKKSAWGLGEEFREEGSFQLRSR